MTPRNIAQAVLTAVLVFAACDFPGIGGVEVTTVNDNSFAVTYMVTGARKEAFGPQELRPGGEQSMMWSYPREGDSEHLPLVKAWDGQGNLIFCHRYRWDEIKNPPYRVHIRAGQLDCG